MGALRLSVFVSSGVLVTLPGTVGTRQQNEKQHDETFLQRQLREVCWKLR